jgi:NADH:ubiquinone oxidoreductase subunit K
MVGFVAITVTIGATGLYITKHAIYIIIWVELVMILYVVLAHL